MTANKEKHFDCLKMKDAIQMQIYTETQNMSAGELLDYFNQKNPKDMAALPVDRKQFPLDH
jgi:hypothetical protein